MKRPNWARDLAWTYQCDTLQPELQGWRKPVWRGSDDWPGDTSDTYWRPTIAIRIPGKRYLIIAVPIRRKHTMTTERRCRSWRVRACWPRRCTHPASHNQGGKWHHHAPSGNIWPVRSYWQ